MSLDELSRAWYELSFRCKYVTAEGDRFQELFVMVMERAHRHDFAKVQPWGNRGDMKCDGYLASERMVFGCYGPKEFNPMSRALAKIEADHSGAVKHWKAHMDAWTLVHNDHHGLPPELLQLLLRLSRVDPDVSVSHWGAPELTEKVLNLAMLDLVALFGAVPTSRQVFALRQEDLGRVIPALVGALSVIEAPVDLRPVPPEKLEYNKLSDSARLWLLQGMQVADRVGAFFDRWEPGVGDKIAAGFRARYQELRTDAARTSDEVLWALYEFAGGKDSKTIREQTAVLALLAFLFESCEIFDRPPVPLRMQ